MAPCGAAPVLTLALVLAAMAWEQGPPGVFSPWQGCAALGRCCPGRDPMCVARGPPRCFCDEACGAARDCCADYARVCSAVSCVVAGWSDWSRCVKPCQVSYRIRQRHVLQEPRNGGVPCPPLEERAGCVEYWSRQGVECQQSLRCTEALWLLGEKRAKRLGIRCVWQRLSPVPVAEAGASGMPESGLL
ncbi:somatomedin-B and thrombospondin type-1 domain-containing protein-like isoform X4 [Nycticebus coucang]|uniref:somatomedin-B and thrombospondin type-1 domain-containing protein-like isoform X4 n=1 Tax=Nycticebus coucang TaxID=9470 RepID=UPI00234DF1E9|nr:somatomedin-B and thrombospondin type-1 domain-containing protein-like isoform X4 [Nycticebus coucang]